jgi:LysM repeat protein
MKILKICGVVAGIHALAFLVLFINPGCSSTTKGDATPVDTQPSAAPTPAPTVSTAAGTAAADTTSPAIVPVPAGTSFYAPTRPNTTAAGALEPMAPVTDVTPAATYTVKSGDSMWLIAHRNHLKVAELAAANSLKATTSLRAGQKLIIPNKAGFAPMAAPEAPAAGAGATSAFTAPTSGAPAAASASEIKYTVKPGEALSTIAKRFKLTTGDLAVRNNISDPRKIRPGQEIIIPGGHVTKGGKKSKKGSSGAIVSAPAVAAPASASAAAPGPAAAVSDAPAPGPETAPSISVPIIRIDGADNQPAPSAAAPVR